MTPDTLARGEFGETFTAEQEHHPAFPPADSGALIWRYLTREKFVWMVKYRRLFMTNAANLGDPLEGTRPNGDAIWWRSQADQAASEEERRKIEYRGQLASRFAAAHRPYYYVSCWHLNKAISRRMWKQYADTPDSVAVRTTVAHLRDSLSRNIVVGIGKVRYINYSVERLPGLNLLEYIMHKTTKWEYERELRAVAVYPIEQNPDHQYFRTHHFRATKNPAFHIFAPPIKVAALIDSVYVRRDATERFVEEVRALCARRGLSMPRRATW